MTDREYFPGIDATEADLEAFDRGELQPWRIDAAGVQWYRRVQPAVDPTMSFGTIRAIPPAAEAACDDQWPGDDYSASDGPHDDFPPPDYPRPGDPLLLEDDGDRVHWVFEDDDDADA